MCKTSINYLYERLNIIMEIDPYVSMSIQDNGYSQEEIACILCHPVFQEELLCSSRPVSVENNVSFVVDLSKLKDPNDVRADDLGAWKCTGLRTLQLVVKCSSFSH